METWVSTQATRPPTNHECQNKGRAFLRFGFIGKIGLTAVCDMKSKQTGDYMLVLSLLEDFENGLKSIRSQDYEDYLHEIGSFADKQYGKILGPLEVLNGYEKDLAEAKLNIAMGNSYRLRIRAGQQSNTSASVKSDIRHHRVCAAGHFSTAFDFIPDENSIFELVGCLKLLNRKDLAVKVIRIAMDRLQDSETLVSLKKELIGLNAWPSEPISDGTTTSSVLLDLYVSDDSEKVSFQFSRLILPGIALVVSAIWLPLFLISVPWFGWSVYQLDK